MLVRVFSLEIELRITLMLDTGSTTKTYVNFYETALIKIPEDSHPQIYVA
jgi:hypothetical protein